MKTINKIKAFFANPTDPFDEIRHKLLFLKGQTIGLENRLKTTNEKIAKLKAKLKSLIDEV